MKAVPKSFASWDYTVTDAGRTLASLERSRYGEKGAFAVDGVQYEINREGLLGDFVLESGAAAIARATEPSLFRRTFVISHGSREFTLRAQSPILRTFLVEEGGKRIGSIAPEGVFTRKAAVDLPGLPLPVTLFLVWLTVLFWRRQADSSGGG
jgi:hypothetical protein